MDQGPDEIREAIVETREELADTIEALGQKADVKGRVTDAAHDATEKVLTTTQGVAERAQDALPEQVAPAVSAVAGTVKEAGRRASDPKNRTPLIAGVAVLLVLLAVVRWRRGRA